MDSDTQHKIIKALADNIDDCKPVKGEDDKYKRLDINLETHILFVTFESNIYFSLNKQGTLKTIPLGYIDLEYLKISQIISFVQFYSCMIYDSRHRIEEIESKNT